MADIQTPEGAVRRAYTEGPNPYPGGTEDTGGSLVPPYEGYHRSQPDRVHAGVG